MAEGLCVVNNAFKTLEGGHQVENGGGALRLEGEFMMSRGLFFLLEEGRITCIVFLN